ncbi:HD-like signal output (HDOD) protein [Luteibacter sp. Sphag1AF]|uniref:HDOD domain-containing protein n=1 Tax=Luteibacter sp. Sphag1AF TaxID=2587031 RepID=UPI00160F1247|nr:HD-like signal output (HDOD) protein [Luteibacter sp. Sphag1AF]
MIGKFFKRLFGTRTERRAPEAGYALREPRTDVIPAAERSPHALPPEDIEDRFYRLILGVEDSVDVGLSPAEQAALRRMRESFGGDRFDVAQLPRLPAVVPQLLRSLRNDDADSKRLAEQIARDTVLVGEIIRVANTAYFRTTRPVSSLPQAIVLIGQDGLRRVVMQLVMRPILHFDTGRGGSSAGERLWQYAERCAHAAMFLGKGTCDPFEAYLAGLVSNTGAQAAMVAMDTHSDMGALPASRAFVAAFGQQVERLSLHAARHWAFPARVVQALAERADPTDAGAKTPLGRSLLAASRLAMLDVLVEHGAAEPENTLLAVPEQRIADEQLKRAQEDLRRAFSSVEA